MTSQKEKKVENLIELMHKNLECSICLDLLKNPVSTKCSHPFCNFCIMEFLKTKRSVPCPLCKNPITKRSLNARPQLSMIVEDVRKLMVAFKTDTSNITKKICDKGTPDREAVNLGYHTPDIPPVIKSRGTKRKINLSEKQSNVRYSKRRKSDVCDSVNDHPQEEKTHTLFEHSKSETSMHTAERDLGNGVTERYTMQSASSIPHMSREKGPVRKTKGKGRQTNKKVKKNTGATHGESNEPPLGMDKVGDGCRGSDSGDVELLTYLEHGVCGAVGRVDRGEKVNIETENNKHTTCIQDTPTVKTSQTKSDNLFERLSGLSVDSSDKLDEEHNDEHEKDKDVKLISVSNKNTFEKEKFLYSPAVIKSLAKTYSRKVREGKEMMRNKKVKQWLKGNPQNTKSSNANDVTDDIEVIEVRTKEIIQEEENKTVIEVDKEGKEMTEEDDYEGLRYSGNDFDESQGTEVVLSRQCEKPIGSSIICVETEGNIKNNEGKHGREIKKSSEVSDLDKNEKCSVEYKHNKNSKSRSDTKTVCSNPSKELSAIKHRIFKTTRSDTHPSIDRAVVQTKGKFQFKKILPKSVVNITEQSSKMEADKLIGNKHHLRKKSLGSSHKVKDRNVFELDLSSGAESDPYEFKSSQRTPVKGTKTKKGICNDRNKHGQIPVEIKKPVVKSTKKSILKQERKKEMPTIPESGEEVIEIDQDCDFSSENRFTVERSKSGGKGKRIPQKVGLTQKDFDDLEQLKDKILEAEDHDLITSTQEIQTEAESCVTGEDQMASNDDELCFGNMKKKKLVSFDEEVILCGEMNEVVPLRNQGLNSAPSTSALEKRNRSNLPADLLKTTEGIKSKSTSRSSSTVVVKQDISKPSNKSMVIKNMSRSTPTQVTEIQDTSKSSPAKVTINQDISKSSLVNDNKSSHNKVQLQQKQIQNPLQMEQKKDKEKDISNNIKEQDTKLKSSQDFAELKEDEPETDVDGPHEDDLASSGTVDLDISVDDRDFEAPDFNIQPMDVLEKLNSQQETEDPLPRSCDSHVISPKNESPVGAANDNGHKQRRSLFDTLQNDAACNNMQRKGSEIESGVCPGKKSTKLLMSGKNNFLETPQMSTQDMIPETPLCHGESLDGVSIPDGLRLNKNRKRSNIKNHSYAFGKRSANAADSQSQKQQSSQESGVKAKLSMEPGVSTIVANGRNKEQCCEEKTVAQSEIKVVGETQSVDAVTQPDSNTVIETQIDETPFQGIEQGSDSTISNENQGHPKNYFSAVTTKLTSHKESNDYGACASINVEDGLSTMDSTQGSVSMLVHLRPISPSLQSTESSLAESLQNVIEPSIDSVIRAPKRKSFSLNKSPIRHKNDKFSIAKADMHDSPSEKGGYFSMSTENLSVNMNMRNNENVITSEEVPMENKSQNIYKECSKSWQHFSSGAGENGSAASGAQSKITPLCKTKGKKNNKLKHVSSNKPENSRCISNGNLDDTGKQDSFHVPNKEQIELKKDVISCEENCSVVKNDVKCNNSKDSQSSYVVADTLDVMDAQDCVAMEKDVATTIPESVEDHGNNDEIDGDDDEYQEKQSSTSLTARGDRDTKTHKYDKCEKEEKIGELEKCENTLLMKNMAGNDNEIMPRRIMNMTAVNDVNKNEFVCVGDNVHNDVNRIIDKCDSELVKKCEEEEMSEEGSQEDMPSTLLSNRTVRKLEKLERSGIHDSPDDIFQMNSEYPETCSPEEYIAQNQEGEIGLLSLDTQSCPEDQGDIKSTQERHLHDSNDKNGSQHPECCPRSSSRISYSTDSQENPTKLFRETCSLQNANHFKDLQQDEIHGEVKSMNSGDNSSERKHDARGDSSSDEVLDSEVSSRSKIKEGQSRKRKVRRGLAKRMKLVDYSDSCNKNSVQNGADQRSGDRQDVSPLFKNSPQKGCRGLSGKMTPCSLSHDKHSNSSSFKDSILPDNQLNTPDRQNSERQKFPSRPNSVNRRSIQNSPSGQGKPSSQSRPSMQNKQNTSDRPNSKLKRKLIGKTASDSSIPCDEKDFCVVDEESIAQHDESDEEPDAVCKVADLELSAVPNSVPSSSVSSSRRKGTEEEIVASSLKATQKEFTSSAVEGRGRKNTQASQVIMVTDTEMCEEGSPYSSPLPDMLRTHSRNQNESSDDEEDDPVLMKRNSDEADDMMEDNQNNERDRQENEERSCSRIYSNENVQDEDDNAEGDEDDFSITQTPRNPVCLKGHIGEQTKRTCIKSATFSEEDHEGRVYVRNVQKDTKIEKEIDDSSSSDFVLLSDNDEEGPAPCTCTEDESLSNLNDKQSVVVIADTEDDGCEERGSMLRTNSSLVNDCRSYDDGEDGDSNDNDDDDDDGMDRRRPSSQKILGTNCKAEDKDDGEDDSEDIIVVKKRKSQMIEDSDSDVTSCSQTSTSDRHINLTSSSAFSTQSEIMSTQKQEEAKANLDKLRREIARIEASLSVSKRKSLELSKIEKRSDGRRSDDDEVVIKNNSTVQVVPLDDRVSPLEKSSYLEEEIKEYNSDNSSEDLFLSPPPPTPPDSSEVLQYQQEDEIVSTPDYIKVAEDFLEQFRNKEARPNSPPEVRNTLTNISDSQSNNRLKSEFSLYHSTPKNSKMISPFNSQANIKMPSPLVEVKKSPLVFTSPQGRSERRGECQDSIISKKGPSQNSRIPLSPLVINSRCEQKRKVATSKCFAATSLLYPQLKELQKFVQEMASTFYAKFHPSVTHLIVKTEPTGSRVCERTLKFFQAVARGCWILDYQYIIDCKMAGTFLPEDSYEVQGDTVTGICHHGPRKSRMDPDHSLLRNLQFYVIGDSQGLSQDNLKSLIINCHGSLVLDPADFTDDKVPLIVTCTDMDGDEDEVLDRNLSQEVKVINKLYKQCNAVTVSREWILDSLTLYEIQALDEYVITSVKGATFPKIG